MKITEILMAEHAVFHNLFDHIESVAPGIKTLAEIKSIAQLVGKVMEPHARTEDDLFIEPLEHCFEQIGQNETFHQEHVKIDELLAAAGNARSLKEGRRLLLEVIAMSRVHFEKEERIVFPMAERVLKAKTLSELGAQWLRQRESAVK
jgi:hemerythrin-like domain-containing protein